MPEQAGPRPFLVAYPNISEWVTGKGWIEIGADGYSSSLIRVLDEGGMIWECDDNVSDVDEALQAADTAIATWFEDNGFESEQDS